MTDTFADLFSDPTRCYARECRRENQCLVHLAEDPTGMADLCWQHAYASYAITPLMITCLCGICAAARAALDVDPAIKRLRIVLSDVEDEVLAGAATDPAGWAQNIADLAEIHQVLYRHANKVGGQCPKCGEAAFCTTIRDLLANCGITWERP